jgi:hypothetical protein
MDIVTTILVATLTILILAAFISAVLGNTSASRSSSSSKRSNDGSTKEGKVYPARRSPYRATSIINRGNACPAVKSLLNFRFLDLDKLLPSIPISSCNIGHCNCAYVRHSDRRDDDAGRRVLHSLQTDLYARPDKVNRRVAARGRRKGDLSGVILQY